MGFSDAFQLLSEEESDKRTLEVINGINASLASGQDVADTLAGRPDVFSGALVEMLRQGSSTEQLAGIMNNMADEQEKYSRLNKRLLQAAYYPVTIMSIALLLLSFIMVFVVPVFSNMFADFGAALPGPTQIVVVISDILRNNFLYILIGFLVLIVTFFRSEKFSSQVAASMPIIGKLIARSSAVAFLRNLSINLSAGTSISFALSNAAQSVNNLVFRRSLLKIAENVADFAQLKEALRGSGIFSGLALQMIDVGAKSGDMGAVLEELADYYEKEVENSLYTVTSFLDVMLLISVGLIVGFIVIAMYLPIFQMGSVV